MKQIVYNGAYGPEIRAAEIPFVAGVPVAVEDAVAVGLLAKPNFNEVPAPAKTKITEPGA